MDTHLLTNAVGDRIALLDFGARITSIELQIESSVRSLVLGYPLVDQYRHDPWFLGCTVGRFANRIGGARYTIDGKTCELTPNEGIHQLHGGPQGFDKKHWTLNANASHQQASYSLLSPAGDQGHPGNLLVTVTYRWTDERVLLIDYEAVTDAPTHVNLTHHSYFQLDGHGSVLDHTLSVHGDTFLDVDNEMIPTGDELPSRCYGLDCQTPRRIQQILASMHQRRRIAGGLDLTFVTDRAAVAQLTSSTGDLSLTVVTTSPGLQIYTGQRLSAPFSPFSGICLEPQHFPDAPNHPHFPSTLLRPGQCWKQQTQYRFTSHV